MRPEWWCALLCALFSRASDATVDELRRDCAAMLRRFDAACDTRRFTLDFGAACATVGSVNEYRRVYYHVQHRGAPCHIQ